MLGSSADEAELLAASAHWTCCAGRPRGLSFFHNVEFSEPSVDVVSVFAQRWIGGREAVLVLGLLFLLTHELLVVRSGL